MRRVLPCCAAALGACVAARAATLVVDLNGAADYTDIQAAIDAAKEGDTVLVRAGEYLLSDAITLGAKAVTVRSENGAGETTLRMVGESSVVIFGPIVEGCVLEGFTVTGGKSAGIQILDDEAKLPDGHPRISRCVITENSTVGVYCSTELSRPLVTDCDITRNGTFSYRGSGVRVAGSGDAVFVRCTISRNYEGSGVAVRESGTHVTLIQCNVTQNFGGGISCDETCSVALVDSRISENAGHGIDCEWECGIHLVNCLVTRNMATGILSPPDGRVTLQNCTFEGNGGDGLDVGCPFTGSLVNSIVWNDNIRARCDSLEKDFLIHHSIVQGPEPPPGDGNSNADPLFASPGDYHLQPGSPAIDAGIGEGAPRADIEGRLRPCGNGVDLGAYESGDCWPVQPFVRGDSNADGATNISDAIAILNHLFRGIHEVPCEQAGDANDDGSLNVSDVIHALSFLFLRGKVIEPPVGACGIDPTEHSLACESFPGCERRQR